MFLLKAYRHDKWMFAFMALFIAMQLYYSVQFAKLLKWVDNHLPTPHPIATEMFPFVNYNMYSGKITDWNNYYCFRVYADGEELILTGLLVIQEEFLVNPMEEFLVQKASEFEDTELKNYLQYEFGNTQFTKGLYNNVSNIEISENDFALWYRQFCSKTIGREIRQLRVAKEFYSYKNGKPHFISSEDVLLSGF